MATNITLSTRELGLLTDKIHTSIFGNIMYKDCVLNTNVESLKSTLGAGTTHTVDISSGFASVGGRIIYSDAVINTDLSSLANGSYKSIITVDMTSITKTASISIVPIAQTLRTSELWDATGVRDVLLAEYVKTAVGVTITDKRKIFNLATLEASITSNITTAFTAADTKLKTDLTTLINGKLSLTGGTLSGMLALPATLPTATTHATNKAYVDNQDADIKSLAQMSKITNDSGGTIGITKGVTFSKYFQDNPTMLRHFYANATDNTDSPGTLRGIIGNTGSVSTTAPNGVFWGIGIDHQRKLYGTHSKGNSSTTVEWVRYLDERDEDRIQLPSITKSDGKAKYVTTAGQTMTTFIASLPVGLNTVQIYSSHLSSGYPLGTGSQLRGDIFKMDANSANYKYGLCVVDLSDNSTNKLTFKGTLDGPEDIVSAEWLAIRVQRDMWETIYTSTTGLLLSSNKTLTVRKGMPKMVRITLEGRPIIEGNLEIMVNARKTVNVSTPHPYQQDGFFYGLFEFFDGSVKFERTFTGGASNTLMKIEAIY